MMSQTVYLIIRLTLAVALITALFGVLPASPFADVVTEIIAFIQSDSVHQGMSWLAWFFPIGNVILWAQSAITAILVVYGAKMSFIILDLL